MPSSVRLVLTLAAVLAALAGCSQRPSPGLGTDSADTAGSSGSSATDGHRSSAVAKSTCWTGTRLGADPQEVLRLSKKYAVAYAVAAHALADRPSFSRRVDCKDKHAVEVYEVVRLPKLEHQLTDYAALLDVRTPLYEKVARSMAVGCMTKPLAAAAARTGLRDAVMSPVLPGDSTLGWAPAAPDEWAAGRRVFACTLTWDEPQAVRFDAVFTRQAPTRLRTCINSRSLVFVDCARKHDRERIAVIDAREAVAAGEFPGRKAIRTGPHGRYLAVSDARWRNLDAACTSYLRTISTTKRLTGVANVDVDEWPAADGSYPIYCDADTRPDQDSLITEGSVYDR